MICNFTEFTRHVKNKVLFNKEHFDISKAINDRYCQQEFRNVKYIKS